MTAIRGLTENFVDGILGLISDNPYSFRFLKCQLHSNRHFFCFFFHQRACSLLIYNHPILERSIHMYHTKKEAFAYATTDPAL